MSTGISLSVSPKVSIMGRPSNPFEAEGVVYDGTNDYATLSPGLSGATNTKELTISAWVRFNGGDGATQDIFRLGIDDVRVARSSTNKLYFRINDSLDAAIQIAISNGTVTADGEWHHILFAVNTASPVYYLYINRSLDKTGVTPTLDALIDWASVDDDGIIGASPAAAFKLNASLSELYVHNEFIDPTVEANLRKFISADGKPVSLGSNGSSPTGTQPLVYAPDGDPSNNLGTAGDYTITGSLAPAPDSPSD